MISLKLPIIRNTIIWMALYKAFGCCPYNIQFSSSQKFTTSTIYEPAFVYLYSYFNYFILVASYVGFPILLYLVETDLCSIMSSTEKFASQSMMVIRSLLLGVSITTSIYKKITLKKILDKIINYNEFELKFNENRCCNSIAYILLSMLFFYALHAVGCLLVYIKISNLIMSSNIKNAKFLLALSLLFDLQYIYGMVFYLVQCCINYICQNIMASSIEYVNSQLTNYSLEKNIKNTAKCNLFLRKKNENTSDGTKELPVNKLQYQRDQEFANSEILVDTESHDLSKTANNNVSARLHEMYSIIQDLCEFQLLLVDYFSTPLMCNSILAMISVIGEMFFFNAYGEESYPHLRALEICILIFTPIVCVLQEADNVTEKVSFTS